MIAVLLAAGAATWLPAIGAFALIREQPGATEGGGNALEAALASPAPVRTDRQFRHYLIARALLLSVALAPPFYVLLAQQMSGGAAGLGMLVIAGGIAGSITAPLFGRLADRSARTVMAIAALAAGVLGVVTWALAAGDSSVMAHGLTHALLFLGAHGRPRRGAPWPQGVPGGHGPRRQPRPTGGGQQHAHRRHHARGRLHRHPRRLARPGTRGVGPRHRLTGRGDILHAARGNGGLMQRQEHSDHETEPLQEPALPAIDAAGTTSGINRPSHDEAAVGACLQAIFTGAVQRRRDRLQAGSYSAGVRLWRSLSRCCRPTPEIDAHPLQRTRQPWRRLPPWS
ncbi:MAG: hypothetical protein M5U09_15245 [Gammaproteobacteria bacterium]|nr:hypothetical protein [Gammaproteobacteria bacterium]